ncbi:hypothetical protein OAJ80_00155 [Candidatus Thioglobus sp.]|nr:hypothetical protein [Candidatus Thioglobus sp.]
MNKVTLTIDVLVPTLSLVILMVCIVGATIGINTLMKGKVFNFLLNKKLLLITASIISAHLTFAFVMIDEYNRGWGEVFWFIYFIGFIFLGAKYTPELVLHLKKIHLSNLEDAKEQALREAE